MVGSMPAGFPLPVRSTYVASKLALRGFVTAARGELSPYGVWLTTVPLSGHARHARRRPPGPGPGTGRLPVRRGRAQPGTGFGRPRPGGGAGTAAAVLRAPVLRPRPVQPPCLKKPCTSSR
ncbi:hypothetical protein OG289_38415 [Streptomyces sp. NBC_01235]|nr:hypothetical protein OG289_38415 [Streptomyces sp. NBC_01235]